MNNTLITFFNVLQAIPLGLNALYLYKLTAAKFILKGLKLKL